MYLQKCFGRDIPALLVLLNGYALLGVSLVNGQIYVEHAAGLVHF